MTVYFQWYVRYANCICLSVVFVICGVFTTGGGQVMLFVGGGLWLHRLFRLRNTTAWINNLLILARLPSSQIMLLHPIYQTFLSGVSRAFTRVTYLTHTDNVNRHTNIHRYRRTHARTRTHALTLAPSLLTAHHHQRELYLHSLFDPSSFTSDKHRVEKQTVVGKYHVSILTSWKSLWTGGVYAGGGGGETEVCVLKKHLIKFKLFLTVWWRMQYFFF